jgi:probable phosphoglycerate mutase
VRFDKVLASGLPRTIETAERVLAAAGQRVPVAIDERLQEIRPGASPTSRPTSSRRPSWRVFGGGQVEAHRFLGGESVGELLDRVLPAFDDLLADTDLAQRARRAARRREPRAHLARARRLARILRPHRAGAGMHQHHRRRRRRPGAARSQPRAHAVAPRARAHTTMEKLLAQFLRLRRASEDGEPRQAQ